MIRSHFAITRLLLVPYAVLLALYLAVIGGGGAGLYLHVRAVETRLVVAEIESVIEPLAARLSSVDALDSLATAEPSLVGDLRQLFAELPALKRIAVRDRARGFELQDALRLAPPQPTSPLPEESPPTVTDRPPAERLHSEPNSEFRIRYDLAPEADQPARLAFTFDRDALLAPIDAALASIERAIQLFALVGALSILAALGITAFAMHRTRRIEAHFQEIYRRASITELAAELVHDLRSPLMAFRANVTALKIAPQQTQEIVADLNRDIAAMSDKLSAFLRLTRRPEDTVVAVAIGPLLQEAKRLAGPVLAERGLEVAIDVPAETPQALLQKDAMRDALVNVLINAAQSGQTEGVITVTARVSNGRLKIAVEDRGQGIAAEHLPHLFDAFYTTKQEGNGLGLAIVHRIVTDHDGQVRAENRADGGARILIDIPLQPKEVPRWWMALSRHHPT